eukprot:scaffold294619_cov28-Prasinocladus_malaysianus.AAC.2
MTATMMTIPATHIIVEGYNNTTYTYICCCGIRPINEAAIQRHDYVHNSSRLYHIFEALLLLWSVHEP